MFSSYEIILKKSIIVKKDAFNINIKKTEGILKKLILFLIFDKVIYKIFINTLCILYHWFISQKIKNA